MAEIRKINSLDEFNEYHIADESILAMAEKVSVTANDELTSLCPQKRVAVVTVKTKSGEYKKRVDFPKGEPENPLSFKELEDKFYGLAMYGGLTREECKEVIDEILTPNFELDKIMKIVCKK